MPAYTGGCQCGAFRYDASVEPDYSGHCYCGDCRKASGAGFIPFMSFSRRALKFSGEVRQHRSPAASGRDAVRNRCIHCGSLVFGGERDRSDDFTIYAGSLDDPSAFRPTVAIFTRDRPLWAMIPPGLKVFQAMPG